MEEKNDRISALQFGIIAFFLAGGLYVGMGIVSMFEIDPYNAWIATLISPIMCIIPILLLIYILNFHPDKNIFEKNKIIFGKWIGSFVNLILVAYVLYMTVLVLWSNTSFAITMYLTKTPELFIGGIFLFAAVYVAIKGIESVGRLGEILFFMSFILLVIIVTSLYFQLNMDYLKPIMANGISPVIKQSCNFTSYLITPLILLTVIPKNNIVKAKNSKWFLIGGVFAGILLMFVVFFLIPGVITPELSAIYRFPAYYIQRKINIGGVINNLENVLSLHWFFHTLITIIMGICFINKFFEGLFKIKKAKTKNIGLIIISIISLILSRYIFTNATSAVYSMKYQFPLFFSGTLLLLVFIICFVIFIKRHRKKA